jgi:hypothetical protein
MRSALLTVFCLEAFASSVFAQPTDFVPDLCQPGKKCCFSAHNTIAMSQSTSAVATEPQATFSQFCVTSNLADTRQFKATFYVAREKLPLEDLINDDGPTGIDLVDELIEDSQEEALANTAAVPPPITTLLDYG